MLWIARLHAKSKLDILLSFFFYIFMDLCAAKHRLKCGPVPLSKFAYSDYRSKITVERQVTA